MSARRPGFWRRAGRWLAARLGLMARATASPSEPRRATLDQPTIALPKASRPAAAKRAAPGKPKPAAAPAPRARRRGNTKPKPGPTPSPTAAPPRARAKPLAAPAAPPPATPRQSGFPSLECTVEGARIHAVERPGRPGGPTIILVHGAGLDHRDWTFGFMAEAPTDWRLIAFDRPGFGRSERPRGAASALPATQARLLRAAAIHHGLAPATLVGHSWGGAVVMAWALDAPDTVLGVASLAGAVAPWSLSTTMQNGRRIQEAARRAMGAGGMREAAVEALRESFTPDPIPAGYADHVRTDLRPMTGPAAATMADISTINGALGLMAPRYPELNRPVELVYGEHDAILPHAEQIVVADRLSKARVTLLPKTGHMVHHSEPGACLAAIGRLVAAPAAPRT